MNWHGGDWKLYHDAKADVGINLAVGLQLLFRRLSCCQPIANDVLV